MNVLAEGSIAIDTNVFMHLFHETEVDPESSINSDAHIDTMLEVLQRDGLRLLTDHKGKIVSEHIKYLHPIIKNRDDTDTKGLLLRYWILDQDPEVVELDKKSELYRAIESVIHEKLEAVDRVYVYVSHKAGKPLVTNDIQHILFGPSGESNTHESNRRSRLRKATKKLCSKQARIYSSREAFEALGLGGNDAET